MKVAQVQKDMNDWKPSNLIWSMDQGMTSEENRRILQRAGGQCILGEKLCGVNRNEDVLDWPANLLPSKRISY